MNYIKQLTHFFKLTAEDENISPTHISLFMALFQHWNQSRFQPSIQIVRDEMMALAKISSKATYHRAMAYLHKSRYINYTPSYNPYLGSRIEFFPSDKISKNSTQNSNNSPVQILTTRPINEPYNKLYSNTIISHNSITERALKKQKLIKKISQVSEENSIAHVEIPPKKQEVEKFFIVNNSNLLEALKFFNHYKSNGWLIGGKTPMVDWQASAKKWIANSNTFNRPNYEQHSITYKNNRSGHLHTATNKNYNEPL